MSIFKNHSKPDSWIGSDSLPCGDCVIQASSSRQCQHPSGLMCEPRHEQKDIMKRRYCCLLFL